MLRWGNKQTQDAAAYPARLQTDVHSHLLPAIDDGVQSFEEALDVIRALKKAGYKKLVTTPHISLEQFPNTRDGILAKHEELLNFLQVSGETIDLHAAAEYYLDENFTELARHKQLLTFGNNYVLFETSHMFKPAGLADVVKLLQDAGYRPVLAHPERYAYLWNHPEQFAPMRATGVLFQVNLLSLAGHYTPLVQKTAEYLLEHSLVDVLGSDTHKLSHTQALQRAFGNKKLQQYLESHTVLNPTL
jgi:tyrosine-protein phosphatase YwqE